MKKLLCLFFMLLAVLSLSVTAFAAGTEEVTVKTNVADPVPGTLVEISVSVSGAEPVLGCDIMFAYDDTLFEEVSGGWLYTGGTFEAGQAKITFTEPQDINGTTFVLKLRVRADAVYCETTVDCNVTVTDASGKAVWFHKVTPAQIKIRSQVCEHTFENIVSDLYLKAEATCISPAEYYQSCSICGAPGESVFTDGLPSDHIFEQNQQEEYLIQEATCTAPATYCLSCRICGEKSEETFTAGEPLPHTLVEVVAEEFIATPGDCKTPPTYYLSCEVCKEMGTVTFAGTETLPHEYKSISSEEYLATPGDCKTHPTYYVSCSLCGEAGEETFPVARYGDHVHDFVCDTVCKVCGEEQRREQGHTPSEELSSDEDGHWTACAVCAAKMDQAAHIPGPEATPDAPQTCTVCGFVLAVHESHVCEYEDEWLYDDEEHWHECIQCGGKADKDYHVWEINTVDEVKGEILKNCAYCEATKKEILETEPPQSTGTVPTQPQQPTTGTQSGSQKEKDNKNTLLIVFGILLSVSLIANGVLTYFVITFWPKKKPAPRKNPTPGKQEPQQ